MTNFALLGDICYSVSPQELRTAKDAYVVSLNGKSAGIFDKLPEAYQDLPQINYRNHLILPGLVDLHVHAPQYRVRGMGMDLELIDWLNTYIFPEEVLFADLAYAENVYTAFVRDVKRGPNTRTVVFATPHVPATILLMDLLERSGLVCLVGKVSMDRNAPANLVEKDTDRAISDVRTWLTKINGRYERVSPILTPRFVPACSEHLMAGLRELQREFGLGVQSHLSENQQEVSWVQDLVPDSESYGHAYNKYSLFGGETPTIMAHCVWPSEAEFELIRKQQILVAHCPQSNINLASGVAPIRRYLDAGISVGLGSDVAGGTHTSIFRAMSDAIGVSKLYWRLVDQKSKPLTFQEVFHMGTRGGGHFFGQVGSFDIGYELDALILDDRELSDAGVLSIQERLERVIHQFDDKLIQQKYVCGTPVAL